MRLALYLPEGYPDTFTVLCDAEPVTPSVRDAATGRIEVVCAGRGQRILVVRP